MVKLNFAHLCDNAFLSKEGKINIIGVFEEIYTSQIPDLNNKMFHSFFIVTNFTVLAGEYIQKIVIKRNDNKEEIFTSPEMKRGIEKDGEIGFIGNFGVVFPIYGEYTVEIYLENNIYKKLSLKVFKPENHG